MHTSKVRTSKPWSVGWLYNVGLAHRIKQYIVQHNLALSKHAELDMASIAESTTIEHLDEKVVCKLFGYEAAEDYYTAASSMQFIPQIQTPSLFLIAEDDPFLGRLPIQVSSMTSMEPCLKFQQCSLCRVAQLYESNYMYNLMCGQRVSSHQQCDTSTCGTLQPS